MRILGCDPVVDEQHRHARRGDVVAHREVVDGADVLEAENHAAAVQVQRRAARLHRRTVVPVEIQRGAVRGGHGMPFDVDSCGRASIWWR